MDDTISRKSAIEAVRQAVIAGWGSDHGVIDSDVIYEVLEELPSEQRKGGCKRCRQSKNLCSVCIRNENIKDHFYDDDQSHPFADDVMMERGEDDK